MVYDFTHTRNFPEAPTSATTPQLSHKYPYHFFPY